jgi:hypothetical protein
MKKPASQVELPEASDSDTTPVVPSGSPQPQSGGNRVRLLVSACLLGEQVRYDGQHKYDANGTVQCWGSRFTFMAILQQIILASSSGMPSRLVATLTLTVALLFGHACGGSSAQSKLLDAAPDAAGGAATGGNIGGGGGAASGGISGTGGTSAGTGGANTGGATATGGATSSAASGGSVGTGGMVGTGGTLATGGTVGAGGAHPTGGTVGTGGTLATGGAGGTGVDSGSSNSCTCTAARTTLECFCAKYSCPERLGYFLPGGGAAGVYGTMEEYADCDLVLVTTPTGHAPDRYVFGRSTQRLVGARYSSDVIEACPWDPDAGAFRVLTAGQFPESTCVRSACQKGILPEVSGTCADAGI